MLTKELLLEFKELEKKYGTKAKLREPIFIDNFLDEETFAELKNLCRSKDKNFLKDDGYFSPYMFKTEYAFKTYGKIQDKVLKKVQEIYESNSIFNSFNIYAVHKNPEAGYPKPTVSEHLDRNRATYLVDLIIHADFDWPIVVHDKVYHPKENQAILFHPEDQLHYRLEWESTNLEDLYEVAFFHYIEPDHWSEIYGVIQDKSTKLDFFGRTEKENYEINRFFELKKLVATYQKYKSGMYDRLPKIPNSTFKDLDESNL